jgi:uncharacterized protein
MSLKDRIKTDLLVARKARNEAARNVLSVVLGDIQTEESTHASLSDGQIEAKLRKLAENNQQVIDASPTSANSELLRAEIAVLNAYLPKYLTAAEIKDFISARPELLEAVKATKEGQAIGLVVKALKQTDSKVLGSDVKQAVGLLRS